MKFDGFAVQMNNCTWTEITKIGIQSWNQDVYKKHIIDLSWKYIFINDVSLVDNKDNNLYYDYERLLSKRDISFVPNIEIVQKSISTKLVFITFDLIILNNGQIIDIKINVGTNIKQNTCEYSYANSKLIQKNDEFSLLIYFCRDTYVGLNKPVKNIYQYDTIFRINHEIVTSR